MCGTAEHHAAHCHEVAEATPRPFPGSAVDPIRLGPVDEMKITMLVDNVFDALMASGGPARRSSQGRLPLIDAPVFEGGKTRDFLAAEHGFSALITIRRGERVHTLLFDTGISPDGMARNMERLGIDPGAIQAVVLSHGHFDHAGGLVGFARLRRGSGLPLVLHPLAFSRRRLAVPNAPAFELPVLSRTAIEGEGFTVIERREPSVLLDDCVLITGEIDRSSEFERGMAYHEAWHEGAWSADPLILDDQALVVEVRGRGLVVLTGCGHSGAVNIARSALRLTGGTRLHGLLGGFHLTGHGFEEIIEPTVSALTAMAPDVIVPAHCTGWKAQHRIAAALPDAFIPNSVGTTFTFTAA